MAKRQQKNFRLLPETIQKIKEISAVTRLGEGPVVEMAITDSYNEMQRRLAGGDYKMLDLVREPNREITAAVELNGGE